MRLSCSEVLVERLPSINTPSTFTEAGVIKGCCVPIGCRPDGTTYRDLTMRGRPRHERAAVSPTVSHNPPPAESTRDLFSFTTILRLLLSWAVVVAFQILGHSWLAAPISTPVAIVSFVILFSTILLAAFGVVREADHLAHKLGEPYGTLILTLSIVSIEVILISAVMVGPGESPTIGRDSIFAVMMIILNLITGICLLLGGRRYGEQEYNSQGAIAYLSMIVLLTGIALALPNVVSTGTGSFLPFQAAAIAVITVVLYAAFLVLQMRGYRRFFIQPELGSLSIPVQSVAEMQPGDIADGNGASLDKRAVLVRSIILIALILPIVLLAHHLAVLIDLGIGKCRCSRCRWRRADCHHRIHARIDHGDKGCLRKPDAAGDQLVPWSVCFHRRPDRSRGADHWPYYREDSHAWA